MTHHAPKESEERFIRYRLTCLPPLTRLIGDRRLKTLTLLANDGQWLQAEHFSSDEWSFVQAVLAAYPAECSYARLLSIKTGRSLLVCEQEVKQAAHDHHMDHFLKPLRRVTTLVRGKLHVLGLDLCAHYLIGYSLIADTGIRPAQSKREEDA